MQKYFFCLISRLQIFSILLKQYSKYFGTSILRLKSTKYSKFCLYTSFQDDLNLLENGGIPPVFEGRMGLPPPPPLMPFGPYPMLPLKRSPQWTVDRNMKLLAYISIVVLAFLLLIIVIIVLIVFFQHYGM